MRKYYIFLLFIIPLCILCNEKKFVLVIDPGHGGKDPGALAFSKKHKNEKDIVLDIALKLEELLKTEKHHIKTIYTRKKDEFVSLIERSQIANQHKADLFISIHCNSSKRVEYYGTETFVMGIHKNEENLEVAKKENSVIKLEENYSTKYQGFDPESPESLIGMMLLQSAYLNQSLYLASSLQNEFEKIGRKNNGVRQAGFYVISFNSMPSVLIECGYMSNPVEEKFLNNPNNRKKIAKSIFNAIKKYKEHYDLNKISKQKFALENTTKKNKNIKFRLQLLATSQKLPKNNEIFKKFNKVNVLRENNLYKYISGNEDSLEEIEKLREYALKNGYKNAFIVVFKDNKRITMAAASEYLKNKN